MSDYPVLRLEPRVVGICHCTECRKATGAVAMGYADWPRDAFTVTGEVRTYRGRSFCPACGSRLFHPDEGKDTVEILIGALDEAPGDLRPTREGWIIRREPWLAPVSGASQSDRDPA